MTEFFDNQISISGDLEAYSVVQFVHVTGIFLPLASRNLRINVNEHDGRTGLRLPNQIAPGSDGKAAPAEHWTIPRLPNPVRTDDITPRRD